MQRTTKHRLLEFVAPFFLGIGFIIKVVYNIAFAWWLDPWLQRKANRALRDDVQAKLYFLASQSQVGISHPKGVLPFDYALVEIHWENLLIIVSRGRGDTTVSVAPRHAPQDSYELGPVIAALEHRHFSERDIINDLGAAARLLHPRLEALNDAFSEQEFQRTKQML